MFTRRGKVGRRELLGMDSPTGSSDNSRHRKHEVTGTAKVNLYNPK